LLKLPGYWAVQRYVPASCGLNVGDRYTPLPKIRCWVTNVGCREQVASSGPYSRKMILPLGLEPPARTAVSWIASPMLPACEATVRTAVGALETTTVSDAAPHAVGPAGSLLSSPEYLTTQW
jgi:hypothetical protein